MNARQKAKHYKKKLQELYEDYVTSAMMTHEAMNIAAENMQKLRDSHAVIAVKQEFDERVDIDEDLAIAFMEQLTCDPNFRQAVQFYGHTDPETGRYIVRAELVVVKPELEEE